VFYVWVNKAITAPEPTAMQSWGERVNSQEKRLEMLTGKFELNP